MNGDLSPLTSFILPSGPGRGRRAAPGPRGHPPRRAQRRRAPRGRAAQPDLLAYLNRLSDHLFVAARHRRRAAKEATSCGNPEQAARANGRAQPNAGRAAVRDPRADARPRRAAVSDADATLQPFPDASPAKWHLAHTSWFFETFVLRDHGAGLSRRSTSASPSCSTLITRARASAIERASRGMISRPSLDEVRDYRAHVDEALERALPSLSPAALELIELGINHEQQHQELFLTDILATFADNPIEPAFGELPAPACFADEPLIFHPGRSGLVEIGAPDDGFAFDCERPRHRLCFIRPRAGRRARSPTANGASSSPTAAIAPRPCGCPRAGTGSCARRSTPRSIGTTTATPSSRLAGRRAIDWAAPVAHVSFFEADAFARWAGARLPTEAEWEDFAASADPIWAISSISAGAVAPAPGGAMFGDCWEWTRERLRALPRLHHRRRHGRRI